MSDASTRMVIMPALGMTQDTGEIVAWHKQVGDAVKPDDVLMEVETDKTTMEVEAGFDGFVSEIIAAAGTSVAVGSVVAVLTESAGVVVASTMIDTSTPSQPDETVVQDTGKDTNSALSVRHEAADVPSSKSLNPKIPQSNPKIGNSRTLLNSSNGEGIVLASPKAKLAAHEKGISLTRLMRRGVELPIQVADIAEFNTTSGVVGTERSQLQARVSGKRFIDFVNWLNEVSEGEAGASTSWCMFGAAAIRQAMQFSSIDDVLVCCENWADRELDVMSFNPDAAGLLDITPVESSQEPDLLIRNMIGTQYFNYQPSGQDASVSLSIVEEAAEYYMFSLRFDEQRLQLSQALELLQCIGERTEQPLRHLL